MEKISKEYEEAPSGSVYFYNYKEPLMKFEEGFGFYGALVFDDTSDKIQCHFCGEWFDSVGNHLQREHAMTAGEYKARVGLNKTTALVNEKIRAKLIKSGLQKRMKNLRPGVSPSKETRDKIANTLRENRAELKNLHGTCPEQLIDRLQKLAVAVGRTPVQREVTFLEALLKIYGSYSEACRVAGLVARTPGQTVSNSRTDLFKYKREQVKKWIRAYFDIHGERPKITKALEVYPKGVLRDYKKLIEQAFKEDIVWRPYRQKQTYTREQLLKYIKTFMENNDREPSVSDCRRLLLPPASTYYYRFGNLKKAVAEAKQT